MAAAKKSHWDAPHVRRWAFLCLTLLVALALVGGVFGSTGGSHTLQRPSGIPQLIAASIQHDNCPCPSCDRDADACCVSACFSPIGVMAVSVFVPDADTQSTVLSGFSSLVAAAAPSPLFHPPKLLVQA